MKKLTQISNFSFIDIFSGLLGTFFWFLLASFLNTEEYGEIQFYIGIITLSLGISLIANNNTVIIFESKKKEITSILFYYSLIVATFVSIILFILYSRFDLILLLFGMLCSEVFQSYLIGNKSFKKLGIFQISQKSLMIFLTILFNLWFDVNEIIWAIGISYIPFIIFSCVLLRTTKEFSNFHENLGYIFNNFFIRLISIFRKNFDKILIVPILGYSVMGEFGLGLQIYLGLNIFSNIIFKFLLVNESTNTITKNNQIIILLISIIISSLGIIFGPIVVPTLFPEFINTAEIIPILSIAVIPNVLIIIFSAKLLANIQNKILLIGTIVQTITYLVSILVLGSLYGLYGIAMGFLISFVVNAIFIFFANKFIK